ncbi:serine/threonine-protein kinase Sgk2 [Nemania abortiva]|nr:serine/threonine-protein kinase Sgk2 [Nemania abortiva]
MREHVEATIDEEGMKCTLCCFVYLFPSRPSVFFLAAINHTIYIIRIISEYPLNGTLITFRVGLLEDIERLLAALLPSTAAYRLCSVNEGDRLLPFKLLSMLQHVREGSVELNHFRPLIYHIIDNSPDSTIWDAPSIPQTFEGTSVRTWLSRITEREEITESEGITEREAREFDKFFNPKSWCKKQKAMLKRIMAAHDGKKWPVRDWLRSLEKRFLADAPYKLHTPRNCLQFKDFFLLRPTTEIHAEAFLCDPSKFKLHISRLPRRRFIHAFSFHASKMELWVFDRSGAYSSGPFDIHDKPSRFARAFIGYTTMDDNAMGLDTFIERENGHLYITLDDASGKETKIRLGEMIHSASEGIVCRGTACYFTQNNHVAKFSWGPEEEVEHLRLAEQRGVKGVVRVVAHRRITTIAELREGLEFPKPYNFQDNTAHFDLLSATASTSASDNKRKSVSNHMSDKASGFKRRKFNSQKLELAQDSEDQLSVGKDQDLWENKVYSCLIVSPVGRTIDRFKTTKELLESMRDAIRAHQSLYITGNILHRDISLQNIIITEPETADGFKGMLIDLDMAIVGDNGLATDWAGTLLFLAVEVHHQVAQTYRHDLESFFYVLLWLCACQSWDNKVCGDEEPREESVIRKWNIGTSKEIAATKIGNMSVNGLELIMDEFPKSLEAVKPLCLKIRKILFPLDKDERMCFGTPPGDPNQLYEPILAAYNAAIEELVAL